MRKILLLFVGALLTMSLNAQNIVFEENFETLPLNTSSSGSTNWARNSTFKSSGLYSDSAKIVAPNDSAILTTNTFSTLGKAFVKLDFDHICKLEYFDEGTIEVSVDNGLSWIRLNGGQYLGNGNFGMIGNRFTALSYIQWEPINDTISPTNQWWKKETFDISSIAGNKAQVKVRFVLRDKNFNGSNGNYGWLIDNIKIKASTAELNTPQISLIAPVLADSVFDNGPWNVFAHITDTSGIASAKLVFGNDTLSFNSIGNNDYKAIISSKASGTQICYHIIAIDSTTNQNMGRYPEMGCIPLSVIKIPNETIIGFGAYQTFTSPLYTDTTTGTKKYSQHISIYNASELNNLKGDIVKLALKKTNSIAYTHPNGQLKIYLKHTNLTSVPVYAGAFTNEISSSTMVYNNNTQTFPNTNTWVEFMFNDTFSYNGIDNVMLMISWYHPDSASGNFLSWENSAVTGKAITFYGNTINPTNTIGQNLRPNIKFYTDPFVYKFDVNLLKIDNPTSIDLVQGSTNFKVTIKNMGWQTLTKCNINYVVDGISKPTYVWTGNLLEEIVSLPITIGNQILSGGNHTLMVWVDSPNDSLDQNRFNDTLKLNFFHCDASLNGIYTLGGTNANFQTLQELETKLKYCGITGPTTILINPGVYNEQILIGKTSGLSATNTLTLKSSTNNASDVLITYYSNTSDDNYIIKLDGADYVSIKNISFEPLGSNYGNIIVLRDTAQHNTVENCVFNAEANTYANTTALTINGALNSYNKFNFNKVTNFYRVVLDYQQLNSPGYKNEFSNNFCTGLKYGGFQIDSEDSLKINGNTIKANVNSSYFTGLSFSNCGIGMEVTKNKIESKANSGAGIYLTNSTSSANKHLIANNFISITGSTSGSTIYGIHVNNTGMTKFYHNSVSQNAGGSTASALYIYSNTGNTSGGLEFVGNIFSNFAGGFAMQAEQAVLTNNLITQSNYNCIYSNGSYLAKIGTQFINQVSGIAGITAITQKDSNSIFTNPKFYSSTNLHSFAAAINNNAIPISEITTDIDGQSRSLTTPDIGADEFSLSSKDAGLIELIQPLAVDTQNRTINIRVIAQNYGTTAITTMPIKFILNSLSPQVFNWNGNISPGASDTISLGTFTIPALDYTLKLFTDLSQDTININDTLNVNLFGLPLVDLRIVALEKPIDACNMTTTETVKIKIKNDGVGTASAGFTASYKVLGGINTNTETINLSIGPKDSLIYSFVAKTNMHVTNQDSIFTFILNANHTNDPRHANDTSVVQVKSLSLLPLPIIGDTSIPYGDTVLLHAISNFNTNWYADSVSTIPIATGNNFTTPPIFNSVNYFVEANSNIPAQNRFLGTDTTTNTPGSNVCIYEGDGGMHQILVKASELQALGMVAGNITALSFYIESTTYNTPHALFTIKMGHTSASTLTTTFITSGLTQVYQSPFTEAAGWNLHNFSTPFYWNGIDNVVLDFEIYTDYGNPRLRSTATSFNSVAHTGVGSPGVSTLRPNIRFATAATLGCNGFRKKVSINVTLPQFDAQLNKIIEPSGNCGLNNTAVKVRIKNNGTDPIPGGYALSYKINNGAFTTSEIVTQNLGVGDSLDYTFSTSASFPSGANGTSYSLTAKIQVNNDAFAPNDTIQKANIFSDYTPVSPVVTSPVSGIYGQNVQLNASATDTIYWYSNPTLTTEVGRGNSISFGPIFDTTFAYASTIKTVPLTPYTIGNGTSTSNTTTGPSPFGAPSYQGWGIKNQFLILASELRAMGMMKGEISSIAFNNQTAAGGAQNAYTIQIGTTSMNELTKYETNNLTQVYYAASYQDVNGWNTFNFSTPYFWDGQSNLVVQTCFRNSAWVTTGYSSAYNTNTSYISSLNSYSGSVFLCNDTVIKNQYYKRPNIKFTAKGYGACKSSASSVQINVSGIPANDAALMSIVEPTYPSTIAAGTTHPVKVILKNYGMDTLKTATIHYKVRGIAQTNYVWTGNLARNTQDTVTIGTPTFIGGTTQILTWVSNPNSQTDTILNNDTAKTTVNICMGGTYTIGPAGKNYSTINSAISDMIINSICSSVVFELDSGLYTEQVVIPRIPGASALNTIVIKSAQNDSSKVNIVYGNSQSENYIVNFKNAAYVTLKGVTITSTGGNYGNVIVFQDTAQYVNVMNCQLNSTNVSGSGVISNCIYSNSKLVHHITIQNNHMQNGVNSVNFIGEFATRIKAIVLKNNTIEYFNTSGVTGNYLDSIIIENNRITSASVGATYYGINLSNVINGFRISKNKISLFPTNIGYGINLSGTSGTASLNAFIDNNFVNIASGTGDNKGLYLQNNPAYVNILFNTIKIGSGSLASFAFSSTGGSNQYVKNNIFHANLGYTVYITNPSVLSYCNYNNYSTDSIFNTKYAFWMTEAANLQALKAADITKNINSLNFDPIFTGTNDLHINEIGLKGAGSPYAGITYDVDGDVRNASTPDIGADEFFPPAYDIWVMGLSQPLSGCQLTNSETIKVKVRNLGINTLQFSTSPLTITLKINGPIPDSIVKVINSGTLNSGQIAEFTFTTPCNLSTAGVYYFNLTSSMTNDGNISNNQLLNIKVKNIPSINIPFTEGFENGLNANFNENIGVNTAMAVSALGASSGNYGIHFQGGGVGGFSNPTSTPHAFSQTTHVAKMYSCNVNTSGLVSLALKLDLKQNYSAAGNGNTSIFRILLTNSNGTFYLKDINGDSVFKASTPNLDIFSSKQFNLIPYLGQNFSLSFEAFLYRPYGTGSFYGDNVFIDNVNLWSPSLNDVSVREFSNMSQAFNMVGNQHNLSIIIDNFGTDTVHQVPVAYRVNNGTIVRDTFNGNINPSSFATFNFTTPFTVIAGAQTLKAFTELVGDAVLTNDTTTKIFTGLNQYTINYANDFEGANQWYSSGTKSQWELGSPNSTNFTSAHSGSNAWVTILNGNYLNNSIEYLYSPYFVIPSINDTIKLEFWQQMKVQNSSAYGIFQYSTNGTNWSSLGYIGANGSLNWYNTSIAGIHSWSQSTVGWIKSSIQLDPYFFNISSPIQFRFVFKTDASTNTFDGWMIDDFKMYLPIQARDAGVISILSPAVSTHNQDSVQVKIKIKNYGSDTLTIIPVGYKHGSSSAVIENWTGSLPTGDTAEFTFSTKFISPANNYNLCSFTNLSQDIINTNDSLCKGINSLAAFVDGGISAILLPADSTPMNTQTSVKIRIKNYGINSLSNIPVSYSMNGVIKANEIYAGTIVGGDSADYTFTTKYLAPIGASHKLCSKVLINGDNVNYNDSSCSVLKLYVGINFIEKYGFSLGQNIPNPSNGLTQIPYILSEGGKYSLKIVDVLGNIIFQQEYSLSAGDGNILLDLKNINSGVYFYILEKDGMSRMKKMVISQGF